MKRKILIVILTLVITLGLCLKPTYIAKAEEIESEPITEEVIEEQHKSKAQVWYDEHIGWILGGSLGAIIATILEIVLLAEKRKVLDVQTKETKEAKVYAKQQVEVANEIMKKASEAIEFAKKTVAAIEVRFNTTDKLLTNTLTEFNNVKQELTNLKETQKLIACNSKELVVNGTADKVVELLKGAGDEEKEV